MYIWKQYRGTDPGSWKIIHWQGTSPRKSTQWSTQKGRNYLHWTVNYFGTQSFITKLFFCFLKNIGYFLLNFDCFFSQLEVSKRMSQYFLFTMRSYPVKENPFGSAVSESLRYKHTDTQTNRQTSCYYSIRIGFILIVDVLAI